MKKFTAKRTEFGLKKEEINFDYEMSELCDSILNVSTREKHKRRNINQGEKQNG